MKRVLITGANSFVGTNVERWLLRNPEQFQVDTVDTMNDVWRKVDLTKYDTVYHVAGIAHVDPKPEMAPLYYKVNRDLAIAVAKAAKTAGVKQFIYMSSKIVYHASKSLKGDVVTPLTEPTPNDFYGDSKLQAEKGLRELETPAFKVAIIRPPMVYGSNSKGNFLRLGWLATKTPVFPAWHNKRSMIYIDNLSEFVKQLIERGLGGTFFPQNKELSDTVEIVRYFANKYNKKIWISRLFNPFVWLGSLFIKQIPKMFSDSYYVPEMSRYDFEYQLVSFEDSIKGIEISEKNKRMK
jgi:UDP-glucose 4-epimerase